ncbi:hypothetical protein EMMF5_002693 [Cystobasidiomycetes sp. EMM_F5]
MQHQRRQSVSTQPVQGAAVGAAATPSSNRQPPASPGAHNAPQAGHHHHHSHHHHHHALPSTPAVASGNLASSANANANISAANANGVNPPRSKKEEHFLLSLPSHDREAWYDPGPVGYTSAYALDDVDASYSTAANSHNPASRFNDGDADYIGILRQPKLSNRGNKLQSGSKFVRKGRMGGWENLEVFESRAPFPSNNSYPLHSTSTFASPSVTAPRGASATENSGNGGLPDRRLPINAYPITPSLTLVPSNSATAARQDRPTHREVITPYSQLTSHLDENGNVTSAATNVVAGLSRKRKRFHNHDSLATTSGSSAPYTTIPVRAYIPLPPQNPVELVTSSIISRTFSPKNRTLEKLGVATTDLIEQDVPLVRALTRLTDFLRGTAVAGADGLVGLPFSGDDEPYVAAAEVNDEEALDDSQPNVITNGHSDTHQAEQPTQSGENAASETVAAQDDMAIDTTINSEDRHIKSEQVDTSIENGNLLKGINGDAKQSDGPNGHVESMPGASAQTTEQSVPVINGHKKPETITDGANAQHAEVNGVNGDAAGQSAENTNDPEADANIETNGDGQDEDESGDSVDQDADSQRRLVTARIPPAVYRISNPLPYVDRLFITPGSIDVPSTGADGTASTVLQPLDDNESVAEHFLRLDEMQQRQTIQSCLSDLTKFLADSLEYQDRLGEIRDQILGVEKRRKGVWNMARGYAHQLLWEDEQEV